MKRVSGAIIFLSSLLAAMCCSPATAEPVPPKLTASTKVRVAMQDCRASGNERRTIEVVDPNQVKEITEELEALRAKPTGIWAAKYSCSTEVTFFQDAKTVASIHVFPCSSIERAPVEGKRYFTYKEGLNRLSALRRIAGKPGKEHECK